MNAHERRTYHVNELGVVQRWQPKYITNEGLAPDEPYQVEEVQYLNTSKGYSFKPNVNLPTHVYFMEDYYVRRVNGYGLVFQDIIRLFKLKLGTTMTCILKRMAYISRMAYIILKDFASRLTRTSSSTEGNH